MSELRLRVKVDLILGGKICNPSSVRTPRAFGSECLDEESKPGFVQGFYLASYMGAGSSAFSLSPIGPEGTATLNLSLAHGDVDTVKFTTAFLMKGHRRDRCCHLASGFVPLNDLLGMVGKQDLSASPAGKHEFTLEQPCFPMKDNFTNNKAILRFANAGSDLAELSRLKLRASSLHRLDESNAVVDKLGSALQACISKCAVSPLNAGVNFLESFTYGHMANHMTHYSLLGYLFDNLQTPVTLGMVMYAAYQTMHSTDLSFSALRAMPDQELALRFGVPLITRHTACALSNVYSTDYTVNGTGQACKLRETEDIARSFSALNMAVQGGPDVSAYPTPGHRCDKVPLGQAMQELDRAGVTRHRQGASSSSGAAWVGKSCVTDDCENLAQAILMNAKAVRKFTREGLTLASEMCRIARCNPLFADCSERHHEAMAEVLCRLGDMLESGDWSNSFLVASAKSASYSVGGQPNPTQLSGHGAVISRVRDRDTGKYTHAVVEGTTYATVDRPVPLDYAQEVPIKIMKGSAVAGTQLIGVENLTTAIAQNVHEDLGLSPDRCILAHFKDNYDDNPDKCPFYVSAFFTGLSEGPHGSVACVPIDTEPPEHYNAGNLPLFGAPVMGLSKKSTKAIPVSHETLAMAGVRDAKQALKLMADQVEEAWGPGMTQRQAYTLMSYWQPVDSPDLPSLHRDNYATTVRSENSWAYDDPLHAALVVRVLTALADRFNAIQRADRASDGARASAFGQYLSATLRVSIPLPRKAEVKDFDLTTMRNLRQAAKDVGILKLAACPVKAKYISARSKVPSDHLFYHCDGGGLAHAHNVRLA